MSHHLTVRRDGRENFLDLRTPSAPASRIQKEKIDPVFVFSTLLFSPAPLVDSRYFNKIGQLLNLNRHFLHKYFNLI